MSGCAVFVRGWEKEKELVDEDGQPSSFYNGGTYTKSISVTKYLLHH
jgi:hypothetical protein